MNTSIGNRLKKLREEVKLSQDYVAKQLGINRSAISLMESNQRRISADELEKLACIYGVSMEFIMGEKKESKDIIAFARAFNKLADQDKTEIMNLIEFKNQLRSNKIINA